MYIRYTATYLKILQIMFSQLNLFKKKEKHTCILFSSFLRKGDIECTTVSLSSNDIVLFVKMNFRDFKAIFNSLCQVYSVHADIDMNGQS